MLRKQKTVSDMRGRDFTAPPLFLLACVVNLQNGSEEHGRMMQIKRVALLLTG